MAKKAKNNSQLLKTGKKRPIGNKKTAKVRVDPLIANINKAITQDIAKQPQEQAKIEPESISFDELKKMLDGPSQQKKPAKLTVEDASYLEGLLKRWGTNYDRMAKDVRLNRMQWTPRQIEKKHEAYRYYVEGNEES
jgi:hypothetical protein